ncbi:hypothetical protein EAX61_10390 [Dokdonia sinensis]|uniref:Uncharacterized protein n=1 Tax=Dokdonia sinensis TaxID=2479847 RepID=A0A3M0G053_9FLAO|nr:hypothetical protein [Dokdonia sinensis]RMB58018.1 hypothetical protein EAX61_10390 [Dokdonia sinensis]
MRTLILLLVTICTITTVRANTGKKLSSAIYDTGHGDVHIMHSQNGGKAIGIYNQRGHILLSSFTISGRGTQYTGMFTNQNTKGIVSFMPQSNRSWKGNWRWTSDPNKNYWRGTWNGNFKNPLPVNSRTLTRTFFTNHGKLELMDAQYGKTAGFLYANSGKVYYVYGDNYMDASGIVHFNGKIGLDENINSPSHKKISVRLHGGMHGTIFLDGKDRELKGIFPELKKVRFTLEKIKNYESGRGNEVKASANLEAIVRDQFSNQYVKTLYNVNNKKWEKNKEYPINQTFNFDVFYNSKTGKFYSELDLRLNLISSRTYQVSNAQENLVSATINLDDIIRFLNADIHKNSFQNGPDGRMRIPGSDHTFWVEQPYPNIAYNRTVRGYGFAQFSNNYKWGYFYKIEVLN